MPRRNVNDDWSLNSVPRLNSATLLTSVPIVPDGLAGTVIVSFLSGIAELLIWSVAVGRTGVCICEEYARHRPLEEVVFAFFKT
jgi:hypothetical protein